jgi:putative endonuclease
LNAGFTTRYHANQLVYFRNHENPLAAIEREKEIKGRRRSKKIRLVERTNPRWSELSREW